jgi:hypothetical protein
MFNYKELLAYTELEVGQDYQKTASVMRQCIY